MQAAELYVCPNPSIQILSLRLHWSKPAVPRRTRRRPQAAWCGWRRAGLARTLYTYPDSCPYLDRSGAPAAPYAAAAASNLARLATRGGASGSALYGSIFASGDLALGVSALELAARRAAPPVCMRSCLGSVHGMTYSLRIV